MKNLVGLWVNLSRAYEIALLGKFSIKIVFDKEYIQGFDDYESIKSFYKDVLFLQVGDSAAYRKCKYQSTQAHSGILPTCC